MEQNLQEVRLGTAIKMRSKVNKRIPRLREVRIPFDYVSCSSYLLIGNSLWRLCGERIRVLQSIKKIDELSSETFKNLTSSNVQELKRFGAF